MVLQSDPLQQVQADAKKLSTAAQESPQMSETIAKLFKKPTSTTSLCLLLNQVKEKDRLKVIISK